MPIPRATRRHRIANPDDVVEMQLEMFGEPGVPSAFPPIYRDAAGFAKVLRETKNGIGLDLEYHGNHPTIIGIANDEECAAVKWSPETARCVLDHALHTSQSLVAYSGVGADRPVIEEALGVSTPLSMWDDSMLTHYLTHMELCKAPGKTEDEDDSGALGLMNLWTAASFATSLPQWKDCRGSVCMLETVHPCPRHDVFGYCAVDSWAGLKVHRVGLQNMKDQGTPFSLYRELMELSELCEKMHQCGVHVDMAHIKMLEEASDARKEVLFPIIDVGGGIEGYEYFNPKSPKQIVEWFGERGLKMKSTDKSEVKKLLLKQARKLGYLTVEELEEAETLPEVVDALYKLDQYKDAGKGLKAWFDAKWLDRYGMIHPRFIVTGTSSGRLSSSKPNFQNVPARGFGAQVRKAIVAAPGCRLVKADCSQLELRMCVVPETKILTKDLRWKAAKDIRVGEEIIGFDENQKQGKTGVKYRRSIVETNDEVFEESIKVKTDRGDITGAENHYLVVYRHCNKGYMSRQWIKMKDIKVGDRLPFTTEPWEEDTTKDGGYLAGIFDGEGWVSRDGVGFAQAEGLVADHVKFLLKDRNVSFTSWKAKPTRTSKKTHIKAIITTGMWASLRFLGEVRPVRLLEKAGFIWENRRSWGGINVGSAVVSTIERVGTQKLRAISTSTKTYFANGFFSHNCLSLAGVNSKDITGDAFIWLVSKADNRFDEAAGRYHGTARDIAKSVSHGGDYLEGFEILRPMDFTAQRLREIEYGALRVYTKKYMPGLKRDWEYGGGVVCFTGANLAERLFGDKTMESRKRALEIQEDIYFKNFPMLRAWQMRVLEEVERTGGVRLETGRFVKLPVLNSESPKENAKVAVAIKGQGNSAEHIISAMLTYHRMGVVPVLQVHDELVFNVPVEWGQKEIVKLLEPMMVEDWRLADFVCPIKARIGANWLEMMPINL